MWLIGYTFNPIDNTQYVHGLCVAAVLSYRLWSWSNCYLLMWTTHAAFICEHLCKCTHWQRHMLTSELKNANHYQGIKNVRKSEISSGVNS